MRNVATLALIASCRAVTASALSVPSSMAFFPHSPYL
ncbi:MAG: hypothetical protein ACI841_004838, partial [Planctomycetota bacterium]